MWCRSRRFNCILLVYFKRWCQLVMCDLIKHDALLWLVVFQQLWLVHFDPCCSLSDLLPRRSAVARLSCCCVFWSWASKLLEFLFHCPCWLTQFFWLPSDNTELSLENVLDVWSELNKQLNWFMLVQQVLQVSKQHALLSRARGMVWKYNKILTMWVLRIWYWIN